MLADFSHKKGLPNKFSEGAIGAEIVHQFNLEPQKKIDIEIGENISDRGLRNDMVNSIFFHLCITVALSSCFWVGRKMLVTVEVKGHGSTLQQLGSQLFLQTLVARISETVENKIYVKAGCSADFTFW